VIGERKGLPWLESAVVDLEALVAAGLFAMETCRHGQVLVPAGAAIGASGLSSVPAVAAANPAPRASAKHRRADPGLVGQSGAGSGPGFPDAAAAIRPHNVQQWVAGGSARLPPPNRLSQSASQPPKGVQGNEETNQEGPWSGWEGRRVQP